MALSEVKDKAFSSGQYASLMEKSLGAYHKDCSSFAHGIDPKDLFLYHPHENLMHFWELP